MFHLAGLDDGERFVVAVGALLVVSVNDGFPEGGFLEHGRHDGLIGCSLTRNLCRRANQIVGHVAQFIAVLQAHHVTAVTEDKCQMWQFGEQLRHRGDVQPFASVITRVSSVVNAVGFLSRHGGVSHGVFDEPSCGVSPQSQAILVFLRWIFPESVSEHALHHLCLAGIGVVGDGSLFRCQVHDPRNVLDRDGVNELSLIDSG